MMKNGLIIALMLTTVVLFLFLKATGRVRMAEMNPVSAAGLRLVLFVVTSGFFGISMIKVLHHFMGYNSTPLDILIYGVVVVLAAALAFVTTARLTRE